VKTVIEAARTGQQGDGRVFVIPVEEAYPSEPAAEDRADSGRN
jgi:nitrogen regulatory protein PII